MNLDAIVLELAARQIGIVARSQLIELGMTDKQIKTRVGDGRLVVVHRGIYAVPSALPIGWRSQIVAAQLALGSDAALSHRGAARFWGLEGVPDGWVEFTTSGNKTRLSDVVLHRSKLLNPVDVRRMALVNVTKVERTLLDLGAVLPERQVEEAFESALVQRLTTFDRVAERTQQSMGPGMRGSKAVERILHRRDPKLAPTESLFETRFWRLLTKSPIPRPVRQFRVFDFEGFVARLDVAWPSSKIGLEAYSRRHHRRMFQQIQRDTRRHNRLAALGWTVMYESYDVLNEGAEELVRRLQKLLVPPLDPTP